MKQREGSKNYEERRRVIRKKRREIGLSQDKLARLAGVAMLSVSRFETGARDLGPETLNKIEDALADALAGARVVETLRERRMQARASGLAIS